MKGVRQLYRFDIRPQPRPMDRGLRLSGRGDSPISHPLCIRGDGVGCAEDPAFTTSRRIRPPSGRSSNFGKPGRQPWARLIELLIRPLERGVFSFGLWGSLWRFRRFYVAVFFFREASSVAFEKLHGLCEGALAVGLYQGNRPFAFAFTTEA